MIIIYFSDIRGDKSVKIVAYDDIWTMIQSINQNLSDLLDKIAFNFSFIAKFERLEIICSFSSSES